MARPVSLYASLSSPISLQLLKFSYATVPMDSAAPVPWTHLSSKDRLVVHLTTVRSRCLDGTVEERAKFRVLQDPEVLQEDLDLEELALEAQRAIAVSKDGVQHSRDQYVAVIVKVPVIAIKYPKTGGQVRRFQIRFATDSYFYDAMKILSLANVPTIEAGTFPTQRPTTVSSNSSLSTPTTMQTLARPSTTASCVASLSNEKLLYSNRAGSLAEPVSASTSMPPPPRTPTSIESIPNANGSDGRLGSLSDTLSKYFYGSEGNTTRGSIDKHHTPLRTTEDVCQNQTSNLAQSINVYTPRPSTAPDPMSQSLSQILPPKRELPFGKNRAGRRPTSSNQRSAATIDKTKSGDNIISQEDPVTQNQSTEENNESLVPAGNKRKRPVTRSSTKATGAKEPAPKKTRTGAARKQVARRTKESSPVPSVEELLKRQAAPTEKKKENFQQLDTQALLDTIGLPADKGSTATGTTDAAATSVEVPNSQGLGDDQTAPDNGPTFPCTPAEQLINPSTPAAPAAIHTTDMATAAFNPAISPLILGPITSLLMRDPMFADWQVRGRAWADQAEELQRQALQNFIAQNIGEPSFKQLCRILEGEPGSVLL